MKTSANGIALIKKFEGCVLKAYQDVGGVWTIGFGSTGPDVKKGLVWTQKQADERLTVDLEGFEVSVNDLVVIDINQNQFDSLLDFTYNCGPGALEKSTLLKLVNAYDFEKAAEQFKRWTRVNGKVIPQLVSRRAAEKKLFIEEVK